MDRRKALIIAGAAAVLMLLPARRLTRGIANNNPGNIIRTGIAWQGEVPPELVTDSVFEQFIAPEWGIRAIRKELETNFARGHDTVRAIISEWSTTDRAAYIAAVASRLGVRPDARLSSAYIPALVDAIIRQENGSNPYPPELIAYGLSLA